MKVICLLSGGMDSVTMLYHLIHDRKYEVKALGINYGQRHSRELHAAREIAELCNVDFYAADLSSITQLISNSSQTFGKDVPKARYDEPIQKATVIPNRNMIMLSIAIGWAINEDYNAVAFAAHAGDHEIYPDCREEFIRALEEATRLAHDQHVVILRPFIDMTKKDILEIGFQLNVPYERTWTCYVGEQVPCGECGSCTERAEAFQLVGQTDPLYARSA